jgi:hypothetical protein
VIVIGAITRIENGASEALEPPSLTLIWMFANVPLLAAVGVPESLPLLLSNVAQSGWLATENVRVPPPADEEALGVKL